MTAKKKTSKKGPGKAARKTPGRPQAAAGRKGTGNAGPATAAAILGVPMVRGSKAKSKSPASLLPGGKPVKPEWRKFQARLLELRQRLLEQRNGLARDSAQEMAGYSLHMADSGKDNFDRDFALSLLSSDQDAIFEIDEALGRMQRKTYGICELTGKPIPKSRLEAIPWTRYTVEAQAQLEREGALRQRRLGALGTVATTGVAEIPVVDDSDDDDKSSRDDNKE